MRAVNASKKTTTPPPKISNLHNSAGSPYESRPDTSPDYSKSPLLAATQKRESLTSNRSSVSATRPPLQPRVDNQNAVSLTPTRPVIAAVTATTVASSAYTMPAGDSRPRQPVLSAAAAKIVNRTPLTPKVAAKGPGSSQAVSPLGRRAQNQNSALATAQTYNNDVATPPTASFLGSTNITPRSGKRQIRVDSTNTTPTGTPNPENGNGWENGRGPWGVPTLTYDAPRLASPNDSPPESTDSKFFYASDARNTPQAPQQRPASVPQKPATFFYANGISAEAKRTTSPPSSTAFTPVLGPMPEPTVATKFFYANGTPDGSSAQSLPLSASASTVSTSSRPPSLRPGTSSSATGHASIMTQRPASPVKSASTPAAEGFRLGTVPAVSPAARSQVTSPVLSLPPQTKTAGKRRVSIDAAPRVMTGHSRAGSVPTIDPSSIPKTASPPQYSPDLSSGPASPGLTLPTLTMASILQAAEDMGDEEDEGDADAQSGLQSPTKSVHSSDAVSELVANARRERKVQDLEITNASLEAINRTLERQLRKQTAELRRYRRLSRSGRLSLASAASSRVPSETLTETLGALSDVSEDEGTEEEEEELDSLDGSENSSAESGSVADPLSPNGKVFARRKRDERRLQLDLTKHQELLIDSQKMNQSLKRCLNWTEVLIKEGQKALAYSVRVSDVELGGRVLAPLDEEDEDEDKTERDHAVPVRGDGSRSPSQDPEPSWMKSPEDQEGDVDFPDGG